MKDRFFLDTNILVYAYDRHDLRKQGIAQALLMDGMENESAVLSVQVLGEFFTVVTRQIKQPMTTAEAKEAIDLFSNFFVQEVDLALVERAIDTHKMCRISYWDALIISAAERAGCQRILSEDLNDGQLYHSIRIANPFNKIRGQ
ncbi:MAG: PIN domain-containing protein [Deltaproteobacteria bacterium]|nr:PIN domain-containing protein [Deltaproteobacteria bacterium]